MESLFNSPFMVKLQDFGQKLGSNKFLSALQGAMMSLMGVIMIGAISQIITSIGSTMLGLFSADSEIYAILYSPYNFTMNLLSLWVVAFFAYNYSKNLKMHNPLITMIDALIIFFLISAPVSVTESGTSVLDITYLGSTGMFVGFFVVFIVVNLENICARHNIRIKMPDVVPPFLQDSFAAILPLFFNIVIFLGINVIISALTNGNYTIPSGFLALIGAPLNALVSIPGMFILCTFGVILWCFGIHGTMILIPIIMPLSIQAATANAAAHAAGEPLAFYPVALFSAMSCVGGTGNTWPLAILGLRSKSKQISAVAKISIIPGWFNINEPLTFGMPIMFNPILCIPYVLSVPVIMLLTLIAYELGWLMPSWITISGVFPIGFGKYLGTLNWFNAVWDYLMLIPATIVYYPFFKAYEKQLIAKEAEIEAAEAANA